VPLCVTLTADLFLNGIHRDYDNWVQISSVETMIVRTKYIFQRVFCVILSLLPAALSGSWSLSLITAGLGEGKDHESEKSDSFSRRNLVTLLHRIEVPIRGTKSNSLFNISCVCSEECVSICASPTPGQAKDVLKGDWRLISRSWGVYGLSEVGKS
jgi:hypothetical protein